MGHNGRQHAGVGFMLVLPEDDEHLWPVRQGLAVSLPCQERNRVKPWLNRHDLSHIEFRPDVVPRYTNQEARQVDLGVREAGWTRIVPESTS